MAAASLRVAPAPHGASAVAGNMQRRFVPASPRVTGLTKLCCQPRRRTRDLRAQALKGSSLQGNSLAKLQQQLDAAVAREDYAAAAAIRDDLKQLETVSTLAVEEANAAFYRAFMDSDVEAMGEIWGHGDHVQCVHPMAGCIAGREEVMESWRIVLAGSSLDIMLQDVRVHASESYGMVTCLEVMDGEDSRGRQVLVGANTIEVLLPHRCNT
mmetsp:Transcript_16050/g.40784  ORF Transcript_16050/g.40784 Transcript_16050/m.40784 type:complete len:212 (+) Transcript_16050:192-827(+)